MAHNTQLTKRWESTWRLPAGYLLPVSELVGLRLHRASAEGEHRGQLQRVGDSFGRPRDGPGPARRGGADGLRPSAPLAERQDTAFDLPLQHRQILPQLERA